MRSMKRYLCIAFSALLLAGTVPAAESPVFIRGIRPLGMGGSFVAISDDQNAVFYNPAGLTQRQGSQFVLFELPVNVSEDVLNFYNFYKDKEDKLKNFDNLANADKIDLLNEINDRVTTYHPRVRVGFPNTSYLSGYDSVAWGLGLFSQADIGFQFNRSLIIPSISFWGTVDVVGALPLAHRFDSVPYIPGKLSVGTTLKAISRSKLEELNKSVLEFENFDPQLQTGRGFGADLGALYQPTDRWNVGLQITDVGGTTIKYDKVTASKAGQLDKEAYNSMINSEWNVGAAYIPGRIYYWPGRSFSTRDRLLLACDVRDVLNSDEKVLDSTVWKKLHMGAELRWGPLSLRGGFNSGYPSFGGGLRVPYLGLRADYAYWADELGRYAGQIPEWNHQITVAWSWGDAKGRAYGSDAKPAVAPAPVVKKEEPPLKTELAQPTTVQATGLMPVEAAPVVAVPPVTDTTAASAPAVAPVATPVPETAVVPVSAPAAAPAVTPASAPAKAPAKKPAAKKRTKKK